MHWKCRRHVVHTIAFQNFASCWLCFFSRWSSSPDGRHMRRIQTFHLVADSKERENLFSHLTVPSWSSESRTDLQNVILTQTRDADARSFVQPRPAWLGGRGSVKLQSGCLPCSAELLNSSLTGVLKGLPVETLRRIDTFPQPLTEDLIGNSSESSMAEKVQFWNTVRVWLTFISEAFLF